MALAGHRSHGMHRAAGTAPPCRLRHLVRGSGVQCCVRKGQPRPWRSVTCASDHSLRAHAGAQKLRGGLHRHPCRPARLPRLGDPVFPRRTGLPQGRRLARMRRPRPPGDGDEIQRVLGRTFAGISSGTPVQRCLAPERAAMSRDVSLH